MGSGLGYVPCFVNNCKANDDDDDDDEERRPRQDNGTRPVWGRPSLIGPHSNVRLQRDS